MYAIEFEAEIKEGTIVIPENYKELNNKHCRIVLLTDDINFQNDGNRVYQNNFKKFLENPIDSINFYMPTREERNAR